MQKNCSPKHLLMVHGYLFEGSGSNVYVQNVALTWKRQGHCVTVVCQDRKAGQVAGVDYFLKGMPDENTPKLKPGQLRIVVPDIDGLLPVYVWNEYEGYTVKEIPDMTEEEIENYIEKTSACIKAICQHDPVDKVLSNHAILSPICVARALEGTSIPFDVKIHGSAITYSLKPHPRLLKYATPALKAATKIYVGTNFVKNQVLEVFKDYEQELLLYEKIHILSPGMDPQKFCIPHSVFDSERQFLKRVEEHIQRDHSGRIEHPIDLKANPELIHETLVEESKHYNQRICDADLLNKWVPYREEDQIVLYIGAFLNTKGVGELLAIAPSLLLQKPNMKFIFCGFGTYREHMSQLLRCFEEGDLEKARLICQAGDFITKIKIENFFFKISPKLQSRIIITGFVDHSILSQLLPMCSICVVPSKISEAFGMVTVESMAAGVLPICNCHSGLSDVMDLVEQQFPELTQIIRVKPQEFFESLPSLILELLQFKQVYPDGVQQLKQRIRKISVDHFSWDSIALKLAQ